MYVKPLVDPISRECYQSEIEHLKDKEKDLLSTNELISSKLKESAVVIKALEQKNTQMVSMKGKLEKALQDVRELETKLLKSEKTIEAQTNEIKTLHKNVEELSKVGLWKNLKIKLGF